MDESMRNAVTTQKPVALFPKSDPSARCFYRLAEGIEDIFERPGIPKLAFSAYWQKVVERQPTVKRRDVPAIKPDSSAEPETRDVPLSQVERQLQARVQTIQQHNEDETIRVEQENFRPFSGVPLLSDSAVSNPVESAIDHSVQGQAEEQIVTLSQASENEWLDLRLRMNRFTADPNTTPEQIVTLLSSALYGVGERLGHAAVDLLHGLLHALDPETLTAEQKQLLLSDFERLGLDALKSGQESKQAKARYDAEGFGDQLALVQAIRSAAEDVSLESLLESIKYASLLDPGSKE
jgi:hypothetical protein